MSAYIVSKKVIDAIVTVALRGPKDSGGSVARSWSNIVNYAVYDGIQGADTIVTPDELGAALWAANVRSVNYRYSERNAAAMKAARIYVYEPVRNVPTTLEALDLLSTYDYQTCETPRWRFAPECRFIERLQSSLIRMIPGYSSARWDERDA